MKKRNLEKTGKKSIFRALFVPLFLILILQAGIFYLAAVYGGVEETLNQNASDILTERVNNRKNELEVQFNKSWTNLSSCANQITQIYGRTVDAYGQSVLTTDNEKQTAFLEETAPILVNTLRENEVNGIFLILNNQEAQTVFASDGEEKNGICLRDLDQDSTHVATEDLLVERAPSAVVASIRCPLDSYWEARYSFSTEEEGAYYYKPLNAAWDNPGVDGEDLSYFQGAHYISKEDQKVVSYSIPLTDQNGYPYGVLGVEVTTSYLASILPNEELGPSDKTCYILATENKKTGVFSPSASSGVIYNRCFGDTAIISDYQKEKMGGFTLKGRDDTDLYGNDAIIQIYNNNNPFEDQQLVLMGLSDKEVMFSYIGRIEKNLALVSFLTLILGLGGFFFVSRRFSSPITSLAHRVHAMEPRKGDELGRVGIREIDQLVDAIEELNKSASRDIARTEFFSRMSHDMRTPMNAIISFSSEELLNGTTEKEKEEYLGKIHSSGEYLLGLINEVLDMTKIESDKVELSPMPIEADQLFAAVYPIIDELAQTKQIQFHKSIYMQQEEYILVDVQHVDQIAMNLLSNAIKFTPEGKNVNVTVITETKHENPDYLSCKLQVSDQGIGMSQEFMEKMYDAFEQENESLEGTGLGLSIAKKLVLLMGGTIECQSQRNRGTTFTVKIDFAKTQPQAEEKKSLLYNQDKISKEETPLLGKRILVCEDHPLNTKIMEKLLGKWGIHVDTAANGQIGVDMFQQAPAGTFDAILMDIRMPEVDGLEATRIIRNLEREDAKTIPIIAMTANAFAEDVKASSEAGMNAHLSKPIEPQVLYETLATYVG